MARFSVYMPNALHRRAKSLLPPDETFSGLLTEAVERRLRELDGQPAVCRSCGRALDHDGNHQEEPAES